MSESNEHNLTLRDEAPSIVTDAAASSSKKETTHTFVVTTVVTEMNSQNTLQTENNSYLPAVPVFNTNNAAKEVTAKSVTHSETQTQTCFENPTQEAATCSKAIVPLSTCLPSKLLRLHAKRSAQALLHQMEQLPSLDSQFGSEEGATGGSNTESVNNVVSSLESSPSSSQSQPADSSDEKLIDVGMGSSIEDSEESMEEDDELKPLAVDNHVLYDIDFDTAANATDAVNTAVETSGTTAVLSEANLEKFRKHNIEQAGSSQYPHMDNIYLHPNFKYQLEEREVDYEVSPPPAIAPANSPTEQKRVHRSFLTLKKPIADVAVEKTSSVISQTDTVGSAEGPAVNEVDTLDPALIPNDELSAEIADAVEFYFSNDIILKDAFLLKHVRRNKEGFVSLKLVSSFKRVRQLTKDWRVVGYAVRQKSQKIELNDIGTKVRRIDPLPNFDETMPSRTIVACDLPLDKLTIEKVSDIFSKCGEIALIRILKPGMNIPVDVRQFMNKYPEMQQKECALVEYVESSSAREAKHLQGPFQVYDMVAPKKKTGKKAVVQITAPVARMVENYRYFNDATYERTRGGSFSGIMPHNEDLRYKLKRNNSDFPTKALMDMHQYHGQTGGFHAPHNYAYAHQPNLAHRGSYGSAEYMQQYNHYQNRANIGGQHAEHMDAPNSLTGVNANNYYAYSSPRRYSNTSTVSVNTAQAPEVSAALSMNHNANGGSNIARRLSNCSDTYSAYSEMSRRPSNCSDHVPQRRDSNCSENCPCSKRLSDFGQTEVYRKTSQGSIGSGGGGVGERRFSNGSLQFERTYSTNNSELGSGNNLGTGNGYPRRLSNEFNYERKPSLESHTSVPYDDGNVGGGGGGYNVFPRRHSNNFNVSNKLASYDNAQYINGRRISTDSGYDRRYSFGSEYEGSPRSRTGSFLHNYKHGFDQDGQPRSRTNSFLDNSPRSRSGSLAQRTVENLVRTPIGPDGSKGFCARARKLGQTISPVN